MTGAHADPLLGVDGPESDDTGSGVTRSEHDQAGRTGSPRRRGFLIAAAVVVVAGVTVGAVSMVRASEAPADTSVPATVPVAITAAHVPDGTKIGVLLTLGAGEGSEWNGAAQGARVAERRLALGGTDIQLLTRNDDGTADGARAAVRALVDDGVAGIVVATSGSHVQDAVAAATDADVPVVMPYAPAVGAASWSLAPSAAAVGTGLSTALHGATSTVLVDLGGDRPQGVRAAHVISAGSQDDATTAARVARMTGAAPTDDTTAGTDQASTDQASADEGTADAVLVSGPAARQASFVAALQSADVSAPVVLTPDATSPAFASALVAAQGSPSGSFTTVGTTTDDAVALGSGPSGRAMSAFLGGVRVLAGDGDAKNLTGDQAFAAVAGAADSRSHDAVVALVRAVATARSDSPAKVSEALDGLRLGVDDGIAGGSLDFGARQASADPVGVLSASSQQLGLRPVTAGGDTPLVWIADTTAH